MQEIVDKINHAAFGYMAISGRSFCTSAWEGMLLALKRCTEFWWSNFIAEIIIAIGKVSVIIGNLFTLLFLMNLRGDSAEVSSMFGPFIAVGTATWITIEVFLGQYNNCVQALMTCYAMDLELNGPENNGLPKFGPPTFHERVSRIKDNERGRRAAKAGKEGINEGGGNDKYISFKKINNV